MQDWIEQAKEREEREHDDALARERIRLDEVERLKVVFPRWQHLLLESLKHLSVELAKAFPNNLSRHYSVNIKAGGYFLRSQGLPETIMEIAFNVTTQNVSVQHFNRVHIEGDPQRTFVGQGRIGITNQSDAFVDYNGTKYSDPAIFAGDLTRAFTKL